MPSLISLLGIAAGALGALLCVVAGVTRLSGSFYLAGIENASVFLTGVGLMAFACMVRLYLPQHK